MENDKKIIVFKVLDVLKEYSDSNHLLTYNQIIDKLESFYGIKPNVKTIAGCIDTLIKAGYEIEKEGQKGCYLSYRDFEKGELMYLIDAINSSKVIASSQSKDLIERLVKNYSKYDKRKFKIIQKVDSESSLSNQELFYIIEELSNAIEQGKKVSFNYNKYNLNKELEHRKDGKLYIINPYYLVNSNGKYYLVCNNDKYEDISNYKVELITNVKILDEQVKNITSLNNMEDFTIKNYIKENIYMTFGETINATIKIDNEKFINDVVDWFGKDIKVKKQDNETFVEIKANDNSLIYWALQYGEHVEIVKPVELRERFKNVLANINKKYK